MTAALCVAMGVAISVAALTTSAMRPPPRRPGTRTHAGPRRGDTESDAIAAFDWAAGEIRSGIHPAAAVRQALHRHPGVLTQVRRALDRGEPLSTSAERAGDSVNEAWFAHALHLCEASSGSSAEVLERAVAVARERRAWAAERRAQAAQARLSARLLTLVPLAFAAWGTVSSPSVRAAYRATPLTFACTGTGIALNLVGWWWMRRLVDGRADPGTAATAHAGTGP